MRWGKSNHPKVVIVWSITQQEGNDLMLSATHRVFFPVFGRYFHSPTDTKELLYDPASVMDDDTLKFCQKEAWCKMSFFVLSFFYYLYWWVSTINTATVMLQPAQVTSE